MRLKENMKNLSIRLKLILSTGTLAFGYLLFLGLVPYEDLDEQPKRPNR